MMPMQDCAETVGNLTGTAPASGALLTGLCTLPENHSITL